VAGDALIGVTVAFLIGGWAGYANFYDGHQGMWGTLTGSFGPYVALAFFAILATVLASVAFRGLKK
jgi:hypothetical protein